jgi:outer membrane protein assembly factor BamD (BamD/ComL family)
MSYPRNSGNENVQKRSEEVAGQNQNADEDDEKEMSLYEKGMENFNNKNYRKSISYFQKALKKASGNEREEIMYHLALAYENSGKTSKANELYATLSSSKKYGKRAEKKLKESAAEDAKKK